MFNVSGMGHHVEILNISSSSVTIEVASTPQVATLLIGETKKFDVNADNIYDISVGLIDIYSKTANVSIKAINEAYYNPVQNNSSLGNTSSSADDSVETKDSIVEKPIMWWVVVLSIIVVIAAILFWLFYLRKKE